MRIVVCPPLNVLTDAMDRLEAFCNDKRIK
jgi:hypothetical protein